MSVASLVVEVIDARGNRLTDATVGVRSQLDDFEATLDCHPESALYRSDRLQAGPAEVRVEHGRLEGQTRTIAVGKDSTTLFVLGEAGVPMYFREQVRVPVTAEPGLIALTLRRPGSPAAQSHATRWSTKRQGYDATAVDALVRQWGLSEEKLSELAGRSGMRMFRALGGPHDIDKILLELELIEAVEHVGVVVNADENGFSHLTRDIVVQFRGPRREEAAAICKELGCRLLRELVYAPTAFVFRWEGPASLRILDVIDRLAARDDVAWAEPSLVVAPQMDAVTPTDTLWAGCWDRQLVGVQDAWQRLQDAGLQTFGDPNILLAVWDTGVQQSGGIPTNADFAGTLSNGAPKNFGSFDFQNMVANNDTPNNGHGSGVAGVATALANNASPVGGGYGLPGPRGAGHEGNPTKGHGVRSPAAPA